MSECKKTIITTDINKETSKTIDKSNNSITKSLIKNIETIIRLCAEGYAEISALRIRSTIEFIGETLMKMSKRFNISSTKEFQSTITFLARKKIQIDSSIAFNAVVGMSEIKAGNADSDIEFLVGKESILGNLDPLTLNEMDILTLGELGFTEGIDFILRKNLKIDSICEFSSAADMFAYSYTKLSTLDPQTLGALDSQVLDDLDRTIIP